MPAVVATVVVVAAVIAVVPSRMAVAPVAADAAAKNSKFELS